MTRRFHALLAIVLVALPLSLINQAPAHAVEIERVQAAGVEAWLVEDHSNPMIALRLAFRGGSGVDPEGKAGLAEMMAALLTEGAGDLNAQAFQQELDDRAIDVSFDADHDVISGTMRTLTENRDKAFALLGLALTRPRFDPAPVERVRNQMLANLRSQAEDPDWVAGRQFFARVFDHKSYGRPTDGTPQSLAAITVDDLRARAASLSTDRLIIGVAGDITAADLTRLLQQTFGGLPATTALPEMATVPPTFDGGVHVVRMQTPQSAVMLGQKGLPRLDKDYYALQILNEIVGGGGLTSRLFDTVREQRGLAYSVYSGLAPLDHAALIIGSAGTANARVAETIKLIREVWRDVAANGVTAAEVEDAKTYLTGSFPLRMTGNQSIAATLVGIQLYDLGIDYLDRRNALIDNVTVDDVNRIARTILDSQALTFVVAGEPEGLGSSGDDAPAVQ